MKKSFGAKTMIYPAPVWCIGTYDNEEKPNIMTIAWGGICCSNPPCVTISIRKSRYTYKNIMENNAYTVNVPSEKYVKEADYFGIVSGSDVNKLEKTGLTPVKSELVHAPYVREFPMNLECKVVHFYDLGAHTHFVGEIMDVKVDDNLLDADGKPDIEMIRPLIYSPEANVYSGVGTIIGKAFSVGKMF
ncbi:FMN-binding protein [Desulfonema limicola]|uniref:FMN-binding protein n=1 Tax=Desulfonema limicola TaxID=45656 RepID=A0A975BB90_9BACT|nr:flavin reductase family protein [Desulfonema limicola]QTA82113.1 FMN-binding protein [Desulfonema limicola]